MTTIGVFTSGGDAPGMNACLRAVVRYAISRGCRVVGIRRGYEGMLAGEVEELDAQSVSGIVQLGGTVLKTARCAEFYHEAGRARAAAVLREAGIEGLVAIGGDGTFRGAHRLAEEHGVAVIGVPGTIDNDVWGTDATIGFDTAVNTALEAVDRLRDTATSHDRVFFVEVMGRQAGFIALAVGMADGAEIILVPEIETSPRRIWETIAAGIARGKRSFIAVVAEGDEQGGAFEIARKVQSYGDVECRVTVLGHILRGGRPTARDRLLASRLGAAAVEALLEGASDKMAGIAADRVALTPLPETWGRRKELDRGLYELAGILAR